MYTTRTLHMCLMYAPCTTEHRGGSPASTASATFLCTLRVRVRPLHCTHCVHSTRSEAPRLRGLPGPAGACCDLLRPAAACCGLLYTPRTQTTPFEYAPCTVPGVPRPGSACRGWPSFTEGSWLYTARTSSPPSVYASCTHPDTVSRRGRMRSLHYN